MALGCAIRAGLVAGLTALVVGISATALHLRVNLTPSVPLGLWRAVAADYPVARGSVVIACLPADLGEAGLKRGYLGHGECPGGAYPLLKPIGAIAGDTVDVTDLGVFVNGARATGPALRQDGAGRPLISVEPGRYRVLPGEIWLLSNYRANSWDSRYYGPLPVQSIISGAAPFLTF